MDHNTSKFKIGTYEYDGIKLLKENVEQYGGVDLLYIHIVVKGVVFVCGDLQY